MTQIDPEHHKPKPTTSPLDDVHAAPYAAYAERILAGEAIGDNHEANPLSSVMNTANEQEAPELEPGSQEYEQQQMDRFFDEVEAIHAQIGPLVFRIGVGDLSNSCSRDDFEVALDPDTGDYCIQLKNNPESNDILIRISKPDLANLQPLHIPKSLRGVDILESLNYPLATVPDKLIRYIVWGPDISSVVFPRSAHGLSVENTSATELPDFPSDTKNVFLTGNTKLTRLPDLPATIVNLEEADNGSLRYEFDQFPPSLKTIRTSKGRYTRKERRVIDTKGIHLAIL